MGCRVTTARASLPPTTIAAADHALAVATVQTLAMDAVQRANSGHPGMPMGAADMACALWSGVLVHDPAAPTWFDRDRFVLSAGHGSMLLYALLHLSGYDLSLEDLQSFRQLHAKTPGHPEFGETPGVEVTTGPLGTGFAAGVGLALAERTLAARFNRPDCTLVDHFTYGIVSDGDLMEGIASEAASFAGHHGLGKIIYLYDDNGITIDGQTKLAFTEDVGARFTAYGWHVEHVDGHDASAILAALARARADARPSLLACKTVIGQHSPNKAGTSSCHGAPLGAAEIAATKQAMGWNHPPFFVPDGARHTLTARTEMSRATRMQWEQRWAVYQTRHAKEAAQLQAIMDGRMERDVWSHAPVFETGARIATRKACSTVLTAIAPATAGLIGGSADLSGSNGAVIVGAQTCSTETPAGTMVHFGVREHGMAGICNGLALHGLHPFAATFLVFSDFMRGAMRLAALMKLPVTYVLSHDSIFLGEDGPTHQPVEHAMSLRLIPNLFVTRPADANETLGAFKLAFTRTDGPTAILVSRQDLEVLPNSRTDIGCGAYVLWDPPNMQSPETSLDGIVLATGSEVALAMHAAQTLTERGRNVRAVSMPCWKAFEQQPRAYRDDVLPPSITRRLAVEAGVTLGWERYATAVHGIDRFGASAPAEDLAVMFGMTVEQVVAHYLDLPQG